MSTTYSRTDPGQFCLFVDWETSGADFSSGPDPNYARTTSSYQGISIGAVVARTDTLEEVDSLYCELKFDSSKYNWTDEAEKIHGLSREHLEANGLDRDEALAELIGLLLKYWPTFAQDPNNNKICIGGHNIDFDIAFTKQLFNDFGWKIVFHHVKLETSGAAYIAIGKFRSNEVFTFFGAEARGKHNALEDARQSLATARGIKQLVQLGLQSIEDSV